jgi:hypothetical protein
MSKELRYYIMLDGKNTKNNLGRRKFKEQRKAIKLAKKLDRRIAKKFNEKFSSAVSMTGVA